MGASRVMTARPGEIQAATVPCVQVGSEGKVQGWDHGDRVRSPPSGVNEPEIDLSWEAGHRFQKLQRVLVKEPIKGLECWGQEG